MSEMDDRATISIIGAGIAGPVLALSILSNPTLRSRYKPILFDKLPCPEDNTESSSNARGRVSYAAGAAVALTSNALYPLYQLGLKDALNDISCETTTINVWRAYFGIARDSGAGVHKWYNIIRNPGWSAELDTNLRVVERRDLQRILLDKIKDLGGLIVWGKKLKEIRNIDDGKLRLEFEDGEAMDTDLLVGADGNWSSVRKHIIEGKGLADVGLRWAPEFPFCDGIYGIAANVGPTESEWNGPGDTHWILLDQGVASTWALPNGKIFWTISLPRNEPPKRSEQVEEHRVVYGADLTCGGYSFESTFDILQRHEKIWHPVAGTFGEIFRHSDRIVRAPLWHRAWEADEIGNENAVVIGDASRSMLPSSGQGACFAIEDATVLANRLLNTLPGEGNLGFRKAISEYTSLRVPRSKRMANQSYWTGVVGLGARWWWRWLRDLGSAWLPLGGDPKANPDSAKKDPMGWLHNVRYKVESEEPVNTAETIDT